MELLGGLALKEFAEGKHVEMHALFTLSGKLQESVTSARFTFSRAIELRLLRIRISCYFARTLQCGFLQASGQDHR